MIPLGPRIDYDHGSFCLGLFQHPDDPTKVIKHVRRFFVRHCGFRFDIHLHNVMCRADGTLVLNDPIM